MKELYSPKEIITSGLCIGCGSCVAQNSTKEAVMQLDASGELKPHGPGEWMVQPTVAFSRTCPFSPLAKTENELGAALSSEEKDPHLGAVHSAFVGYVSEGDFRVQGSSGGMVSWVASELLRRGLVDGVAHVVATDPQTEGRFFKYRISRSAAAVQEGAKSRYYPVELSEVLQTIREVPGRYAVVGIPCFIKAVHLLRDTDPLFRERIAYTLGLFCGHMKGARFVESFAWQMQVPAQNIRKVEFRYKHPERPANWYNAMLTLRDGTVVNRDWWHLADGDWGAGFFMNHACNFCDDVVAEIADISLGDAWVEPYASDAMGNNVVVVRSALMHNIIREGIAGGRLQLKEVNRDFVVQTQAAGFRQRREGLAYRLTWATGKVKPRKRVLPDGATPAKQRKVIYRMRYYIAVWSHRMFSFARRLRSPLLYIRWASVAAGIYHGMAYHQGKFSEMYKRFLQLKK